MASDFPGAFAALREIMKRHSAGLIVQSDTPTDFTVITPAIGPNKKPIWFGCVLSKKSAVTYHLFSLYFNPALEAKVPPELLRRNGVFADYYRTQFLVEPGPIAAAPVTA